MTSICSTQALALYYIYLGGQAGVWVNGKLHVNSVTVASIPVTEIFIVCFAIVMK
jgi:hypothetical protein